MDDFIDLFISETKATIEGLTGNTPNIAKVADVSSTTMDEKVALIAIDVTGDAKGKMIIAMPPQLATALVDMMMAGEGESKDVMDDDDLDGTKEIVSNIAGAIGTALSSQNQMPKLNMTATGISFVDTDVDVDIENFSKGFEFSFKTGGIDNNFKLLLDHSIVDAFAPKQAEPAQQLHDMPPPPPGGGSNLSPDELKNMNLLKDVKLPVTVRIGSKRMLLKDVINMDIGAVIELNQLANDPLDLLVDNHVIAQGEVVIVDGNFGIQITHIGSKRDRLNQLRG